jgi:hypothetical protein
VAFTSWSSAQSFLSCFVYVVHACSSAASSKYIGPVPMVVHVHGAEGVGDNSDGYSEAWYMPDATNLGTYSPVSHIFEAISRDTVQCWCFVGVSLEIRL